jgi:hypothetical protein
MRVVVAAADVFMVVDYCSCVLFRIIASVHKSM